MIATRWKIFAAAAVSCLAVAYSVSAAPVKFKSKDGLHVFGEFEKAEGRARGTILLFHMAGSNKDEYRPLIPILNKAGFSTLAIDQRSGGSLWGASNETAAGAAGTDPGFADALQDLESSTDYASTLGSGPIIAWGSSYSAALVFLLAAENPSVKAILSFSPAEYIEGYSIEDAARDLVIPVFVTSSPDEAEVANARRLARAVRNKNGVQFVPVHGVHGSSTLRQDADPEGAGENWKAVFAFLDRVAPR